MKISQQQLEARVASLELAVILPRQAPPHWDSFWQGRRRLGPRLERQGR